MSPKPGSRFSVMTVDKTGKLREVTFADAESAYSDYQDELRRDWAAVAVVTTHAAETK